MSTKIVLCLLALIVALLGSSLLGLWPQGPTAGFGSEAQAASVSPFADSEDFTFVAWVYWEGGPDWQRIFEFSRDAERNMYLTPSSNADTLRFAITTSGDVNEQQLNASGPLPTDRWVHVAVTLVGDSGKLYLNGVIVDSGTITLNPNQVTGSQRWLAKSQYNWDPLFKGRLDEVAVFDRALSQSEIQQTMASGWDSLSGQTLALHLDENPTTGMAFITDSSGQENYARLFTLDEENKSVPGKVGQALLFDGVNDYVALSPNRLVPDVKGQFKNLQTHGDPMGFHCCPPHGVGADPEQSKHYQGIARFDDSAGIPYLFITRNQNCRKDRCDWLEPNKPGELLVVKMASRTDRHGERLRSNKLGDATMAATLPPASDAAVKAFYFNGLFLSEELRYCHPGAIQIVGDVLVIPLEARCQSYFEDSDEGSRRGDCHDDFVSEGAVVLIDVSTPESPQLIHFYDFYDETINWPEADGPWGDAGLGVVGVTYVYKGEHWRTEDHGLYLFVLQPSDQKKMRFAWSNTPDLKTTTDMTLESFTWEDTSNMDWNNWNTLNFVRDKNDNKLYLIGADKDADEVLGLYRVDVGKLDEYNYQDAIIYEDMKYLDLDDPVMGDLNNQSGVYVSPTGNLIVYTGDDDEHHEAGTQEVRMGEFRNRDVYYPGTLAETAMCPWAELYKHTSGWDGLGRSLMYDFQDRHLDTWHNLDLEDFNGETSAIRWYLKPGQMLRLYEDAYFGGQYHPHNFYSGLGSYGDLSGHIGDISSFFMGPFADPGGPYSGAEGSSIPLYGANRCYSDTDPEFTSYRWRWSASDCNISEYDRQPTLTCEDNDSIGVTTWIERHNPVTNEWIALTDPSSTQVTVRNIAPVVTAVGTIDDDGLTTISGTITDPGTLDTFNVTIDWGDGAVGPIPYPAGTTTYSATHQYQITTLEVHTVTVAVEDKDGGIGTASTTINVEGGEPIYLPLIIKDSQ